MKIAIEVPDDPSMVSRYLAEVAEAIAAGRREGYADFHTNWKAVDGCEHRSCTPQQPIP